MHAAASIMQVARANRPAIGLIEIRSRVAGTAGRDGSRVIEGASRLT